VKIKEETHISAVRFIEQNSMSFFSRLNFPADIFSEARIMSEKRGFYIMTEGKVPSDQQSETSNDLENFLNRNPHTIKVDIK
jgi:hypothetical protein